MPIGSNINTSSLDSNIDTIENTKTSNEYTGSTIIYFKDIIPTYDPSYINNQTDKDKLKNLLLSWGFSDAIVLGVTEWNIYNTNDPLLRWKGNLLVKETCLHSLKCKNKTHGSYIICDDLKTSGYILLNTDANKFEEWDYIYISELGFGMEKNYSFLWQGKISPAGLLKFDSPNSFSPTNGRYVINKEYKDFWGDADKVILSNFRIQDKDYVSGYQLANYSIYTKDNSERGYYNASDEINYPFTTTKFFNMGFPILIGTNFYDRDNDNPTISVSNNIFNFNGISYDTNKYDIFLCYVPPLEFDDSFYMAALESYRTYNLEHITSQNGRTYRCSEVFYNIQLNKSLTYYKLKSYQLDTDGIFKWKNISWKESTRNFNNFIGVTSTDLTYEVKSYFNDIKSAIQNGRNTDSINSSLNKNRCINNGYDYGTAYFKFTIPLNNIPYFKYWSQKHNNKFTATSIDSNEISIGKISGYGGNANHNIVDTGAILWSLNNVSPIHTASIRPEINLGTQTIYRSKTSLLRDKELEDYIFGRYYSNSDIQKDNVWQSAILDIAGENETTDVGFYCLIGIQKKA